MIAWQLDPAHSSVRFSTRHMMVSNVHGRFRDVAIEADFDPEHPELGHVTAVVQAATIDTGMKARDVHLRSADFHEATVFPTMTFTSTDVEPRGDGKYAVTGDLMIRGETRSVTFDVEYLGETVNLQGGLSAGFTASTRLSRRAWGLTRNVGLEAGGMLAGDEVKVEVDLELARPAVSVEAGDRIPAAVA